MDFQIVDGQTLLDPDEAIGLKLSWVATRADLNDAEGANVYSALHWAQRAIRRKQTTVASEAFLR